MANTQLTDKIKIFNNGTIKECLEKCLLDGYFPANASSIRYFKNAKAIPRMNYTTSTIKINGVTRDATLNELTNIEEFYNEGGRLMLVNTNGNDLDDKNSLTDDGYFVGLPFVGKYKN